MLLRKEKSYFKRCESVKSSDKKKPLVKVPSSSKIPKDFFRQPVIENKSYPDQGRCNLFEFTFMNPTKNLSQTILSPKRQSSMLIKKSKRPQTGDHIRLQKNSKASRKYIFL